MNRDELEPAIALVAERARAYLGSLDQAPLHVDGFEEAAWAFDGSLPEEGVGAAETLRRLVEEGFAASVASSGPRCFHFVTGGVTPAALGADWLASALDQNSFAWIESPLGAQLERTSLAWLRELFDLPADWGGVLTTGATMANFVALACARRWWAGRHGVDVDAQGLPGLPPVPVFASGYVHSTAVKALGMLGIGRESVRILTRDSVGRLDLEELERALEELDGAPALLLATAGEVNAGDFDPIPAMADLTERHGAWLHVDGAFGLFARVSPVAAHLSEGVERADSVIADGHKWLNVPYDCGFAFVKDASELMPVFNAAAAYLPGEDPDRPNFGFLGPESSRRARSFAVWATLQAYGRRGYRELVERNLRLAQRVAERVDEAPDLERLADVQLCIVTFRLRPPGVPDHELDALNARVGEAVLADGRVYVGTTRYGGRVAFRPAIVNWRTTEADVDLLVDVIRELGAAQAT
ncbi:MAG: aspartate aminotransferase family protein [Actinobacteria bacterium]|nr:aspartate aminotransferase family protein [Actinomycetota bacterium]